MKLNEMYDHVLCYTKVFWWRPKTLLYKIDGIIYRPLTDLALFRDAVLWKNHQRFRLNSSNFWNLHISNPFSEHLPTFLGLNSKEHLLHRNTWPCAVFVVRGLIAQSEPKMENFVFMRFFIKFHVKTSTET